MPSISGIHHVTATTADAGKNLDFYSRILGLRLIKLTVNFDDPGSYHFYYGDETGSPGSIMTFFVSPDGRKGKSGSQHITATAFKVAKGAIPYWLSRFEAERIQIEELPPRSGEKVLGVLDPDGLKLELIESKSSFDTKQTTGLIPSKYAVRGLHSVTIAVAGLEEIARLFVDTFSFSESASEGKRYRYIASGDRANIVDLVLSPDAGRGSGGTGVVHHVAFRTANDTEQNEYRNLLVEAGYNVSPVMDRSYFRSIYFLATRGVLFEIATDLPGFTVDETPDALGTELKLPLQYENQRVRLLEILPKIDIPQWPGNKVGNRR